MSALRPPHTGGLVDTTTPSESSISVRRTVDNGAGACVLCRKSRTPAPLALLQVYWDGVAAGSVALPLSGAHEACFHVETRELWMCFVLSSKEVMRHTHPPSNRAKLTQGHLGSPQVAAAGCFVGLNSSNASVQVDLRHLVEPHSRAGRLDFAACHDIDNPTSPPK
eukprot:3679038-Prymnesium_polylepis.1